MTKLCCLNRDNPLPICQHLSIMQNWLHHKLQSRPMTTDELNELKAALQCRHIWEEQPQQQKKSFHLVF